jgi:hypothetical protein
MLAIKKIGKILQIKKSYLKTISIALFYGDQSIFICTLCSFFYLFFFVFKGVCFFIFICNDKSKRNQKK